MTYEELLEGIRRILNIDVGKLKHEKGFNFVYKDDLVVTLEPAPGRDGFYHLYSPVCDLPSDRAMCEDLYQMLMQGHLFGYGTNNNYFGIDKKRNKVFMFKLMNLEKMSLDAFQAKLTRFLAAEEFWRERFRDPRKYLEAEARLEKENVSPDDPDFVKRFHQYV
ncbi:MAG TPA: hypothetical protein DIU37_05010 [Opitutae bacterium]|nr:hypothetical protein [Opitutae bacterium]|tara:strand:+ start:309 stop:800 length:492 start_codon:yes stop_codon:yes gene_type:complete